MIWGITQEVHMHGPCWRLHVWLLACVGCVSQPAPLATPEQQHAAVPFVELGDTTREQLLLRLGTPTWSFEGGRILTWRLEHDGEHVRPVLRSATMPQLDGLGVRWYALVVVFDAAGKVSKFSLVEQV